MGKSLGVLVRQRDVVLSELNDIRAGLSKVLGESRALLEVGTPWERGRTGNDFILRRALSTYDPTEEALEREHGALADRVASQKGELRLWLDRSFDDDTTRQLTSKLFPRDLTGLIGGGVMADIRRLNADLKRLLDETGDIIRRLPYFSDANQQPLSPTGASGTAATGTARVHGAQPPSTGSQTMSIKEDAGRILHAIAEFEEAPGDPDRGRHNLTGAGVARALKEQQNVEVGPDHINDAVELLSNNGYVKVMRMLGTAPYRFQGVELTPAGRLEYENMKERSSSSTRRAADASKADVKKVFVIHGRDEKRRKAMFDFLRSIGLQPIEWSQARALTGKAAPYIGEILEAAFSRAQAVVALLTGDDEAHIRPALLSTGEKEEPLTPQARPNVLFEAGMAMGSHEDRTVFVEVGHLRPFSDIAGRHTIRMSENPVANIGARQEIAARLRDAGCEVDASGTDWHTAGDFS